MAYPNLYQPSSGSDSRGAAGDEPAHREVRPFAGLLVRQADEERCDRQREHPGSQEVDVVGSFGAADGRQQPPHDEECNQAKGKVDEEDPVPADRVGDEPTDSGPEQRREPEDGPEKAQVFAALGRRVEVRHHRQRHGEDGAAAQALKPAEQDELPHLLAETGQDRADQEQTHCEDDDRPAAEDVGQLAVDRPADRGGQQVDRDHPRVEVVALQVGDDLRQSSPDDGLV